MNTQSFFERIESQLDFNRKIFFLVLTIFYVAIRYITNDLILQNIPGFESLEEDGSLTYFHIFNTLNYLWTPFSLLWKFLLTTFLLWMGSFAWGYKISFGRIWSLVLLAEVIFIMPELLKLLALIIFPENWSVAEMRDFYPLSILSLMDYTQVPKAYIYPLQALNLFELVYILSLAVGIASILKKGWKAGILIVSTAYILIFLGWLVFYILAYR
ncbi:sulfate ABC transporter permease [Mongoliitalea daihaiensis]|uniref:sulfate ABC transporter permease n=1 Tax=Mongoliitalea daihaiensis TaxID=2782006 RepID=UPI001F3B2057|nr:sulfate ABC transporter permease [Mongoliitalea daihaiensis]UJP64816.1 sulfate ABC transporter permease [Mongoliitalea daihaiensis]